MTWYDNATDAHQHLLLDLVTRGELAGEGDDLFLEAQHSTVSFDMTQPHVENETALIQHGQLSRFVLDTIEGNQPETVFRQINNTLHTHVFLKSCDILRLFPLAAVMVSARSIRVACDMNSMRPGHPDERIKELGTAHITIALPRVLNSDRELAAEAVGDKTERCWDRIDPLPMLDGNWKFYEDRLRYFGVLGGLRGVPGKVIH